VRAEVINLYLRHKKTVFYSFPLRFIGHGAELMKIIIIFIYCNWVVTQWQWLFYMYIKYEIGYY